MFNKAIFLLIIFLVGLCLPVITSATTISDLEQKRLEIMEQQNEAQMALDESNERLTLNRENQKEIQEDIKKIDLEIGDLAKQIDDKNEEIGELEGKINVEIIKINELEKELEKRDKIIRERLVSAQAGGWKVSHLEVILGAHSFADLVERSNIISQLVRFERNIFEEQEAVVKELEKAKQKLVRAQEAIIASREQLEALMAKSEEMKQQKEEVMKTLHMESQVMEEMIFTEEEEKQMLIDQEREINRLINFEIVKEQNKNSISSLGLGQLPEIAPGTLMNPAVGYVSSYYGKREGEFHYGIDIANASANVPIVAAADGIVTSSYYSSSYGNVVMVAHYINGEVITSLYAHMEYKTVSVGKTVSKGEKLGVMGNTGQSFGQHLHFELMKGPWRSDHANTFNPLPYLDF